MHASADSLILDQSISGLQVYSITLKSSPLNDPANHIPVRHLLNIVAVSDACIEEVDGLSEPDKVHIVLELGADLRDFKQSLLCVELVVALLDFLTYRRIVGYTKVAEARLVEEFITREVRVVGQTPRSS